MLLSLIPAASITASAALSANEAVFFVNFETDGVTENIFAAEYNGTYYAMGPEIEGQPGKRTAVEIMRTDGNEWGASRIVVNKSTAELFKVTTERYTYSSGSYPIEQFITKNGYIIDNEGTLATVESTDSDNSKWAFSWESGYSNHQTYRKIYLVIDGEKRYFTLCESAQLPDETHIAVERFHEDCKHANMVHYPAKAPTCKQDGNNEYWECPECSSSGYGYFLDEDGLTQTYNRPTIMSYGAADNDNDGVCDDCGKNMPVFKKVTAPKEIVAGGKYILAAQNGDTLYAMATGSAGSGTDLPAVAITPETDGTVKFKQAASSMVFELQFAHMCTEWGNGIRYGIVTGFQGRRSELAPASWQGEFYFDEYSDEGAKYGFYVGLDADGSTKMHSAYAPTEYFRSYGKGTDRIFTMADYTENADYTAEETVYLYRLTDTGTVGGSIYHLNAEKSDTDYTVYNESGSTAEGGTNVTGIPDAMTQTAIDDLNNTFITENNVVFDSDIQINTNVQVTVKSYMSEESMTLSLDPVAKISCGGTEKEYPISDSSFDGTPMTVALYIGDLIPAQVIHEKQNGTKEYFYPADSEEVTKNEKAAFRTFEDIDGNKYVSFHVTEFSDVRILSTPESPYPDTLYYGLNQLTDDALRNAYETIRNGVEAKSASIDLSACDITQEELEKILELYRYDHSEHYWMPNAYSMSLIDEKIVSLNLEYLTGFDETAFADAVDALLKTADGKTTDYDKALALHDALVSSVTYDTTAPNAHNAYGAIVGKKAVCEGYAEAYQCLLQRVGIQSYIVSGTSKGEGHEWNLVRLDGQYYYTDVTWDDPVSDSEDGKPIYYPYFNITTARLTEDHTITDTYNILPVCSDESKMYAGYTKLSEFTVDTVAAAFKSVGTQKIARIYNTGNEDFGTWFSNNFNDVATKVGITGASFSNCGREYYIASAPAQTSISMESDGTVAVTCAENGKYCLIFADYEGEMLSNIKIFEQDFAVGVTKVSVPADINLAAGDKIMLWESMTNIRPLCDALVMK